MKRIYRDWVSHGAFCNVFDEYQLVEGQNILGTEESVVIRNDITWKDMNMDLVDEVSPLEQLLNLETPYPFDVIYRPFSSSLASLMELEVYTSTR